MFFDSPPPTRYQMVRPLASLSSCVCLSTAIYFAILSVLASFCTFCAFLFFLSYLMLVYYWHPFNLLLGKYWVLPGMSANYEFYQRKFTLMHAAQVRKRSNFVLQTES